MPGLQELRGRLVLALEDGTAHGALVEQALAQAGARIAGPFGSCKDALIWLERNTPDLAVLDIELGGEPCADVARELRHEGVPFVVFSATEPHGAPREFRNVPWIDKSSMNHLAIALAEAARLAS